MRSEKDWELLKKDGADNILGGTNILTKKIIIDTNVYLYDPGCIKKFENSDVYIPLCILEELDKAKKYFDETARNAQIAIKKMESFKINLEQYNVEGRIQVRIPMRDDSFIYFTSDPEVKNIENNIDNKLIQLALDLEKEGHEVIIISRDVNVRLKCKLFSVESNDYIKDMLVEEPTLIYSGMTRKDVEPQLIDQLYNNGNLPYLGEYPNEMFLLKAGQQSAVGRYLNSGVLKPVKEKEMWGIRPRNVEQAAAIDILNEPSIQLVTLIGKAGCGKTIAALACGLEQVLSVKRYNKLIVTRPIEPMGRDLGYLPGDIDEKMAPWMGAINDNLEVLFHKNLNTLDEYKNRELIQVEPLTYIRGRSIPKSFIIIDEAQNLSPNQVKTIITRVGEGTKIVLTGDIEQIDSPYFDFSNNGLTCVVEKFKEFSISGHITLMKGERSELATLAAKVL